MSGRRRAPLGTVATAVVAAVAVVTVYRPPQHPLLQPPFQVAAEQPLLPFATPAPTAFGRSGEVKMRFVLPGQRVDFPLELRDDRVALGYQWVRVVDSVATDELRPLLGEVLVGPATPGFYRLALVHDGERRLVDGLTVTVLVPFGEKHGPTLQGVRLGTWAAERRGDDGEHGHPRGFVPVADAALALPISTHLRLRDFLTTPDTHRDGFPGFAALDPRLLDKLELVMTELRRNMGSDAPSPHLLVNSGFRPPAYNRTVNGAAKDSRHQYGDAADVRIDLNGDGRFSAAEARKVTQAVDRVEREHPDLVGGLGLYTSRRYRSPYVHIDARGKRARWTG